MIIMKKTYPITIALIAANILLFIICEFTGSTENTDVLIRWGAMYTPYVQQGAYWRLFAAMFLHAGIRHLLNNMVLLGALGTAMERTARTWRYVLIYLGGGLIANVISYLVYIRNGETVVSVGASGCVYAVMGGLIWIVIRGGGRAAGLTLRQMLMLAALSLYFGFFAADVANLTHVAGLIAGFVLAVIVYRSRKDRKISD